MSALPPRPKPGYADDCERCQHSRTFDGGIACYLHRTDAERAWFAEIARISNAPRYQWPEPTLF